MGDGKHGAKFGGKERGTGDKGTDSRLVRDPPDRAPDEAAQAQAIVDLRDKYRADPDGLIKLGVRLQKEFRAAGKIISSFTETSEWNYAAPDAVAEERLNLVCMPWP